MPDLEQIILTPYDMFYNFIEHISFKAMLKELQKMALQSLYSEINDIT